jgi:hypothetical protein
MSFSYSNIFKSAPTISASAIKLYVPFLGYSTLNLHPNILNFFFLCGVASSLCFLTKFGIATSQSFYATLRSLFNANKYLDSDNKESLDNSKYYAVVFGTATKAGKAFAHFLA